MLLDCLELFTDPFPHAVGKCLDVPYVEWPDGGDDNEVIRLNAAQAVTLSPKNPWRQFVEQYCTKYFLLQVCRMFGKDMPSFQIDDVGVRGVSDASVVLDCQAVINSPTAGGTTPRDPHVDNPCEIFAGLWYLPGFDVQTEGGDLQLYRLKVEQPTFHRSRYGKGSVSEDQIELAKTIPYEYGTLVMFPNSPRAIHAVSVRGPSPYCRKYINFIAETKHRLFEL